MTDLMTQVAAPARADAVRAALCERARGLGIDAVGFAAPELPRARQSAYRHYIAAGHHGDMAWLARDPERRQSPKALWPQVETVIVLRRQLRAGRRPARARSRAATARRSRSTPAIATTTT